MRRLLIAPLLVVPALALALDYTDVTSQYEDAPFSRPEAAAISVLTNLGAVQGNPDGTFQPKRTVNRAEFLKIAFMSAPGIAVSESDADACFPDVRKNDWFSRYVCLAKVRNTVAGYPDGRFRPENPVNYAEALKMLAEMFHGTTQPWQYECVDENASEGCKVWFDVPAAMDPWYKRYADWARKNELLLSISLEYDAQLSRGQVARLTASFRAHHDGELDRYRLAEQGKSARSSSSASSVGSGSSITSSVTSSVPSVSSVSSSSTLFPAKSHQLLIGRLTPVLFDGVFTSVDEDAILRSVKFELEREIKSITKMYLVDATGKDIGQLFLDTDDNANKTKWVGNFGTGTYLLPKDKGVLLGLRVLLADKANGGGSKDMFEITDAGAFSIFVAKQSEQGRQIFPTEAHYPLSETLLARLESVRNVLPERGTLMEGANRQVASFTFSGTVLSTAGLRIDALTFHISAQGVNATNWRIGGPAEIEQLSCGVDSQDRTLLTCAAIPDSFRMFSGDPIRPVSLYADIATQANVQVSTLQVRLTTRGKIGENGDIWWSDGFGTFHWVEETATLAEGTVWTVER